MSDTLTRFVRALPDGLRRRIDHETTTAGFSWAGVGIGTLTLGLWTVLFAGLLPMPPIPEDLAMTDPGAPEAGGVAGGLGGVAAYLLMWGVMMAAMMYPAISARAVEYVQSVPGTVFDQLVEGGSYLVGYSGAWTLTGFLPLAAAFVVDLPDLAASHGRLLFGVGLLVAGGYQFSRFKRDAVAGCCTPCCSSGEGLVGAFRAGVGHFRSCFTCTWALCTLMVLFGSMNRFWMLLLAAVFALERTTDGDRVAATVGVLALVAGVAVLALGAPGF